MDLAETFNSTLDDDRAWRKKELSELVQAVKATDRGSQLNETLRRALAILLNAHWEGLVKASVDAYASAAKAVGAQEARKEGAAFLGLALEETYDAGVRREKRRINNKPVRDVVTHPLTDVLLRLEYDVGSLWDEVPSEIADRVGDSLWWNRFLYLCGVIDVPIAFEAGDRVLVNRVVRLRHDVAHGGQTLPDQDELIDSRDRVVALLDLVVESLQDSMGARRFAR